VTVVSTQGCGTCWRARYETLGQVTWTQNV